MGMLDYKRVDRIGETIRSEISSILLQEINDPRIQLVSITRVKVTADLRHAKIYVSIIGSEEKKKDTFKGLQSARGFIQRKLGERIRLRYTPEISFTLDTIIDEGIHIQELLNKIKKDANSSDDEK